MSVFKGLSYLPLQTTNQAVDRYRTLQVPHRLTSPQCFPDFSRTKLHQRYEELGEAHMQGLLGRRRYSHAWPSTVGSRLALHSPQISAGLGRILSPAPQELIPTYALDAHSTALSYLQYYAWNKLKSDVQTRAVPHCTHATKLASVSLARQSRWSFPFPKWQLASTLCIPYMIGRPAKTYTRAPQDKIARRNCRLGSNRQPFPALLSKLTT